MGTKGKGHQVVVVALADGHEEGELLGALELVAGNLSNPIGQNLYAALFDEDLGRRLLELLGEMGR
jgi:hypothetical protein